MPDRRFGWPCGGPILTWVLARIRLLSRPNITRNASILSRVPWQIASGNTINNKVIFMLKFWRYFFTWWLQVGVFVILHTCIYMTVTGAPKFESAPPLQNSTFLATEFSLRGTVFWVILLSGFRYLLMFYYTHTLWFTYNLMVNIRCIYTKKWSLIYSCSSKFMVLFLSLWL